MDIDGEEEDDIEDSILPDESPVLVSEDKLECHKVLSFSVF
jgi:hypothetical protein